MNNRIKSNQQSKDLPLIIKVNFYENIDAQLLKKNMVYSENQFRNYWS
jgi:hypothetical protein